MLLVAGVCKTGQTKLVDYCLESKFSHVVIDDDGTHICKLFCSIKGAFTYITVSFGLSGGSKKKKRRLFLLC